MRGRAIVLLLAVALVAGGLPLWIGAGSVAELDVHAQPWRTHSGRLTQRYPVGQRFECSADGLRRIEVGLVQVRRPARGGVRLSLFEEGVEAPLRQVDARMGELADGGELVAFEFEPVEASSGRRFRFVLEPTGEVKPGDHSAAFRVRGGIGHEGVWGWQEHAGPRIEGRLRHVYPPGQQALIDPTNVSKPDDVPHANLRAVAFAARGAAPRVGPVRLELWEEGVDGAPVRSIDLAPEDEVQNGWLTFSFEPIRDSRWKRYRYVLTLHEGAVLLGDELGPSMRTFHGLDGGDPRLLGMTRGGLDQPDRDLVFRAWCAPDRALVLARLGERGGGALLWALAAWLAATTLLALSISRGRGVAPEEPVA